jgi:ornithine decarboxylase
MLPEMTIGEWLYVEDFGAYTIAASTEFNGFQKSENIYIMTC